MVLNKPNSEKNMIHQMALHGDQVFTDDMMIGNDDRGKKSKQKTSRKPEKKKSSLRRLMNCMMPF